MKLYLDRKHEGTRSWQQWGAQDFLKVMQEMDIKKESYIFIHISDFFPCIFNDTELSLLKNEVRKGGFAIVVVTGGDSFKKRQQNEIESFLNPGNNNSIHFLKKVVPVRADTKKLEQLFGMYVNQPGFGGLNFNFLYSEDESKPLAFAFKLLLQIYIIGQTNKDALPLSLKKVKASIVSEEFNKIYWSPVLLNDALNPYLTQNAISDIEDISLALSKHNFDQPIPEEIIQIYREHWFKQLISNESNYV